MDRLLLFRGRAVASVPREIDVRALRERLGMTQHLFAARFGFPLQTLRHWEYRRRKPTGASLTLLNVIAHNPRAVLQALKAPLGASLRPLGEYVALADAIGKREEEDARATRNPEFRVRKPRLGASKRGFRESAPPEPLCAPADPAARRSNREDAASAGPAVGAAPRETPGPAPRETPGAAPREPPGAAPRETPGAAPRETPGVAGATAPDAAPVFPDTASDLGPCPPLDRGWLAGLLKRNPK